MTKTAIKPFQRSLSLIIIPVCFVLCFIYGWTFISTVFDLDNFYGHLYDEHYHVHPFSFAIYNFLIAFISGLLTFRLVKGILKGGQKYVKLSLWIFLILTVILLIGEFILSACAALAEA